MLIWIIKLKEVLKCKTKSNLCVWFSKLQTNEYDRMHCGGLKLMSFCLDKQMILESLVIFSLNVFPNYCNSLDLYLP